MNAFWISLIYVFIAEMGDKTQLVALAFAARYKPWIVLAGVFLATAAVHIASVAIGEAMSVTMPDFWIKVTAGAAFVLFGLWTLRGDKLDDDGAGRAAVRRRFGPLITVAAAFFIAELGDKTMLMTITIASEQKSFAGVWLGSTLGMVLADGLAIAAGKLAGARLPADAIRYGAATIFIVSGIYTLYAAFV